MNPPSEVSVLSVDDPTPSLLPLLLLAELGTSTTGFLEVRVAVETVRCGERRGDELALEPGGLFDDVEGVVRLWPVTVFDSKVGDLGPDREARGAGLRLSVILSRSFCFELGEEELE